jgi:hypothetical protein
LPREVDLGHAAAPDEIEERVASERAGETNFGHVYFDGAGGGGNVGKPEGIVDGIVKPDGRLLGMVNPLGSAKGGSVGAGAVPPSGSLMTVGCGAAVPPPSGGSGAALVVAGGGAVVVAVAGATDVAAGAAPESAAVLLRLQPSARRIQSNLRMRRP